jgi:carbon-monoxide dehydrogenase medium subunit
MYPYPFSYHRPASITEALDLIGQFGDEGKVLAGGHSLLPVMKLRLAQPAHLVDITGISDLRGIREIDGGIQIGALTTHHDILSSSILAAQSGLLPEMAEVVGDQQVRNRGTIGGTLAHADPAADYPAGVLALEATIVTVGPEGSREIAAADFFTGFLETALGSSELITSIRVPSLGERTGYRYEKMANPASGYATVGVAAVATVAADGSLSTVRVGITGASDVAWRATSVEEALVGTMPSDQSIRSAAALAIGERELLSDVHAPAEYRERVTRNLVFRAVKHAIADATGS